MFRMNRKKRLLFFAPIVAVACVETVVLQVSVASMIVLTLLYFLLKVFLSDIVGRTGEYVLIAVWLIGLFVPMHVVAKKYE